MEQKDSTAKVTNARNLVKGILQGKITNGEELKKVLSQGTEKPWILVTVHNDQVKLDSLATETIGPPKQEMTLAEWEQAKPQIEAQFQIAQITVHDTGVPLARREQDVVLD
ncbi:hypothetical protein [Xanthocytophaga agilis]|uniref:Uncharacterized protein n=1 Tax=Xanthocytophaga agilis TaxID=3048010 RepID=A0AAE3R1B1_9BACT|nr:hypothetical protein [Xanthocytophaga agilis]MDJ1501831.1 hypothetical protein [Xanthocytophaga agilis]